MKSWEVTDHTADYAFRVWGRSFEELFLNAITALQDSMYIRKRIDEATTYTKIITLTALDRTMLLVDLLREIHYLIVTEKLISQKVIFKILTDTYLSAEIRMRNLTEKDRKIVEIKAITYHKAIIYDRDGHKIINVICDI
ncbi:MAG: archease [Candidatus Cloacimonetes bacterium]|nr:archease [Candidatus Cloacimonadota bacterium]